VGAVRPANDRLARAAGPLVDGDGGLQQARQPALPSRRRKTPGPEQLDLLGLDAGEGDGALGFAGPAGLAPVLAAHAANQGSPRGDDLMPSF
jgi:hypothetical protein